MAKRILPERCCLEPWVDQDIPQWPQYGPDITQNGPKHITAYNIQNASHIPGLAECAVSIE